MRSLSYTPPVLPDPMMYSESGTALYWQDGEGYISADQWLAARGAPKSPQDSGGSWLNDGFRVGTLFTINSGAVLKVNAVTASKLTLTTDGALTNSTGTVSIQRKSQAVTFDATNWYGEVTVQVQADTRYVDTGHIITSAGVSAGIDMALHVVARLLGPETARATARQMEYPYPE